MSAIVGDSSWIFPRNGAVSQCQFWDNFPIADKMEFPDYNGDGFHQIFLMMCHTGGWIITPEGAARSWEVFNAMYENRGSTLAM